MINIDYLHKEEFWDLLHTGLLGSFTFTHDSKTQVIINLKSYLFHSRLNIKAKWMWSKRVVGYRDTRTNVIYYNTRAIKGSHAKLAGLIMHELAHLAGYVHHDKNSYMCRKLQNKYWYKTAKKLKSVNYQLTSAAAVAYRKMNASS